MYKFSFIVCISARNRITAAESRRKSKSEAASLKEEVQRLASDLRSKNEILLELKEKLEMFDNGKPKEEIERVLRERRAAASEAAAVAAAAAVAESATAAATTVVPASHGQASVPATGKMAEL